MTQHAVIIELVLPAVSHGEAAMKFRNFRGIVSSIEGNLRKGLQIINFIKLLS